MTEPHGGSAVAGPRQGATATAAPRARWLAGPAPRGVRVVPTVAAVAGAATAAVGGLQELGFSDYEQEALPAVRLLLHGDVAGFLSALPGYPGAVILQAPFALLGGNLGAADTDLWAWRLQALPGLVLLAALGALLGSLVERRASGRLAPAWGALTAAVVAGSPFAMRAEMAGHPEELLVVGLVLIGVLLALRGRPGVAGAVVGVAAVAKPWAAIAIPVVLVVADDRRALVRTLTGMAVAGVLLAAPTLAAQGLGRGSPVSHAGSGDIFKPLQAFWFLADRNPSWSRDAIASGRQFDVLLAPYAQRLAVPWAAAVSHPLVLLVAVALAALYRRRRVRRHPDALLLLAAASWWRCVLDTWNADYYVLGALVALATWEALRGRPPWAAIAATGLAWLSFRGALAYWHWSPDAATAAYLAWAVPFGAGLTWRALDPDAAAALVARLRARRADADARVGAVGPAGP